MVNRLELVESSLRAKFSNAAVKLHRVTKANAYEVSSLTIIWASPEGLTPDLKLTSASSISTGSSKERPQWTKTESMVVFKYHRVSKGCTKKIFVGGLTITDIESDFKKHFDQLGGIKDVVLMYDQNTQRPRGFDFITFDSEERVDRVLHKTFHELNGKSIIATPKL
nr:heterogeneous nuclear ribonucleoprotein 1-like [Tanacetum cinerariifolium]